MSFLETAITLSSTCFSVFNAWTCWGQNKEKKSDDEQDEKTSQGCEGKAGVQKGSQSICYLSHLSIGLKLFSLYQSGLNPMGQQ